MTKKNCVVCSKPLKVNTCKPIHRKCWLKTRDFNDRYLDFLFVNDRKHKPPSKSIVIRPCESESDDEIEEIKKIINDAKPVDYEINPTITYAVDIGGNIITI